MTASVLKQDPFCVCVLRLFDFGCLSQVYTTVSCGQSKRNVIFKIKEQIEQLAWHSLHFSCSRFLTISKFLTQVASKGCRSMQLLGQILNLFDAVAEVCNASWCCQTKQNEGTGLIEKGFIYYMVWLFLTYVLWCFLLLFLTVTSFLT